eukprot:403370459
MRNFEDLKLPLKTFPQIKLSQQAQYSCSKPRINSRQNQQINKSSALNKASYKFSLIGAIWVTISVVTTAAILPFSVALPLNSTLLKLSWRNMTMVPFLFIICIYEARTSHKGFKISSIIKSKKMIVNLTQLVVLFILMQSTYILSGQYTIMSHASILSNLGGVFIVILRVLRGKPAHKFEYFGLLIAFGGLGISVLDQEVEKIDSKNQQILLGDCCAILCSLICSFYYQKNSEVIQIIPSSFTVFITIVFAEILLVIYGITFDTFTFNFNSQTGVFGFFDRSYALYTIFVCGMITGSVSIYSAAVSLKYFPPVLLLIAYLFEPLISQLISCLMRIDKAPGLLTYLGGIFTLIGILAIFYGGQKLEMSNKQRNQKSDKSQTELC